MKDTKDTFELSMFQLGMSEEESFDLLYTALRKEKERQQQLEKEYCENNNINQNEVINLNVCTVASFMEQLKDQNPSLFLSAELIYNQKINKES